MSFLDLVLHGTTKAPAARSQTTRDPFVFHHAGWMIVTPPPAVPGAGKFARNPTAPVRIDTADGAWLPPQTVTPATPRTAHLQVEEEAEDGADLWSLIAGNGATLPLTFSLELPSRPDRHDVELTLAVAACTPGPPIFSVVVNEQLLKIHQPSDDNWSAQRITIPADLLIDGRNRIVVRPIGTYHGVWLQSVTFASARIPLAISSRWLQICAGVLRPGETFHEQVPLLQGAITPDAQIGAFAGQFGIDAAAADPACLLADLSAHLAASFSRDGTLHPVSIEPRSTVEHCVRIGPAPDTGLTFQAWQLALVFEANDRTLVQALGARGPILIQQFPASS